MISVIDYDGGNCKSVINILKRLNLKFIFTNNKQEILKSDRIILPGVSNFKYCIDSLKKKNLDIILYESVLIKKKKILGICSGMQILGTHSEEGNADGLNFIKGFIKKIPSNQTLKVPHMGWNKIDTSNNNLFNNIKNYTRFYFCHSYHFVPDHENIIINYTNYNIKICAAYNFKNIYGVQFHPEKSFLDGSILVKNFCENC